MTKITKMMMMSFWAKASANLSLSQSQLFSNKCKRNHLNKMLVAKTKKMSCLTNTKRVTLLRTPMDLTRAVKRDATVAIISKETITADISKGTKNTIGTIGMIGTIGTIEIRKEVEVIAIDVTPASRETLTMKVVMVAKANIIIIDVIIGPITMTATIGQNASLVLHRIPSTLTRTIVCIIATIPNSS